MDTSSKNEISNHLENRNEIQNEVKVQHQKFSAVIIAGGLNSRMGGNNKAFLKIGGKTILSRLLNTLEKYFDEILLVTKNPSEYSSYIDKRDRSIDSIEENPKPDSDIVIPYVEGNYKSNSSTLKTVTDLYSDRSSLTGIHSGLYHAKNYFSFVVPCDAPFIQPSLIRLLLDSIEPDSDIVIPYYDQHYEPLCAVYSKRCITRIESLLNSGDYRIYNFFHSVNIKKLGKDKLEAADPQMISFFNVNTPQALEAAIKAADKIH
ncbi:MAG: molybdenum cofactor guanylyltransferase [Desulfamplus sp.]|nr:molybdenum cofactor guanylyltransferase [Desulfamplus sp.]